MRFKTGTLLQVLLFVGTTGLLIALVGATFAQVRIEDNDTYRADFTDASGLDTNVDVRVNGVTVGSVSSIERRDSGGVVVAFTVPKDLDLTTATQARIRYANLTGDRYLEITQGEDAASAQPLKVGATIPESRTQAALELDDLFAGFDPLMQALAPEEVNELTTNILAVTEGEAGAVESMLANVGSFTSGLAERDELIGSVITNLGTALGTVDARRAEFDRLIVGLDGLTAQLDQDRAAYGQALTQFALLGTDIGDFIENIRPGFATNIDNLATVSERLTAEEPYLREILAIAPDALNRLGRLGGNASQFNFFLCGLRVRVEVPGTTTGVLSPNLWASDDRCKKGANN